MDNDMYKRVLEKALLIMCRDNKDLVNVYIDKAIQSIEIEKERK